jgi:hypothetical protein
MKAVYLAFWMAALTVVLLALEGRRESAEGAQSPPGASAFRRALVYALPASLILHVGATAWVYHVDLAWPDFGPMLAALGFARILVDSTWVPPTWPRRFLLAAIVVSLGAPEAMLIHGPLGFTLSPFRMILAGIALGCWLTYPIHRSRLLAVGSVGGLAVGAMGHSLVAVAENVGWLIGSVADGGTSLVPRTATGWGVLAVVLAFVLLGLGAGASLWKPGGDDAAKAQDPPGGD